MLVRAQVWEHIYRVTLRVFSWGTLQQQQQLCFPFIRTGHIHWREANARTTKPGLKVTSLLQFRDWDIILFGSNFDRKLLAHCSCPHKKPIRLRKLRGMLKLSLHFFLPKPMSFSYLLSMQVLFLIYLSILEGKGWHLCMHTREIAEKLLIVFFPFLVGDLYKLRTVPFIIKCLC